MAENTSQVEKSEVPVKCGYMFVKRPHSDAKSFRIKAWQSKYFVLRRLNNNCRLEYFKNESACNSAKAEKKCISLANVDIFIDEYNSRSQQHSFILCVKGQFPLVLACGSKQLKNEWIAALKEVAVKHAESQESSPVSSPITNGSISKATSIVANSTSVNGPSPQGSPLTVRRSVDVIADYYVTVRLTPSSEENDIRGDYIMRLTSETITLMSLDKSQEAISWPIVYVRKFKSDAMERADRAHRQLLTLEISNKSPRGQGMFQFHSESANKIAAVIRSAASQHFIDIRQRREVLTRINTWTEKRLDQSDGTSSPTKRRNTVAGSRKVDAKSAANPESDAACCQDVEHSFGTQESCDTWSSPEGSLNGLESVNSLTNGDAITTCKSKESEQDIEQKISDSPPGELGVVEGEGEGNSYIDVLADEHAEPIHISDRKCSDSPVGANALALGESTGLKSTNASSQSGSSTADCEDTFSSELSSQYNIKEQSSTHCSKDTPVSETESLGGTEVVKLTTSMTDAATRRLYNDLVAQISNPMEHPQNVFPSKTLGEGDHEQVYKAKTDTKFIVKKQLSEEEEAREEEKRKDLMEKLNENPQLLLEEVLNQLSSPQKHNAHDMFPLLGHRNSITEMSTETFQEKGAPLVSPQPKTSRNKLEQAKKLLGKSKSDILSVRTSPPPLPMRVEAPREVNRRSEGDLLESIARNTAFSTHHSPTQVGKGLRNSPLGISSRVSLSLVNSVSLQQSEVSIHQSKTLSQSEAPDVMETCETTESMSIMETVLRNEQAKSENAAKKTRSCSLVTPSKHMVEKPYDDKDKKRKFSLSSKIVKSIWKNTSSQPNVPLSPGHKKSPERRSLSSASCVEEENEELDKEKLPEQQLRKSLSPFAINNRLSGSFSDLGSPDTLPKPGGKISGQEQTHVFIETGPRTKSHPVAVSSLLTDAAPLVPPRKKEEPPPLPPRKIKPSQGSSCSAGCHSGNCTHQNRKRKSGTEKNILGLHNGSLTPPPPVPPRKEIVRSPSPSIDNPKNQQSTPQIQLTGSSLSCETDVSESDSGKQEETCERISNSASERTRPPVWQRSLSDEFTNSDIESEKGSPTTDSEFSPESPKEIKTTTDSEFSPESPKEIKTHELHKDHLQEGIFSSDSSAEQSELTDGADCVLNQGNDSERYIDVVHISETSLEDQSDSSTPGEIVSTSF